LTISTSTSGVTAVQAPGNFFGLRQRRDALARAVTYCHHSRSVRRRAEPAIDFRPEDIISSLL